MPALLNEFSFQSIKPGNIDSSSPLPLYHQIYLQLKRELMMGNYKDGDRFFSYRKLKEIYGVELRTVSEAIDLLVVEGFVTNKPASGTYVLNLDATRKNGVFVGNFWYVLVGRETFEHPFYFRLLKGIERRIDKTGLKLIVGIKQSQAELFSWFTPSHGDGVILTGMVDDPALLEELSRRVEGQVVTIGAYKNIDMFPGITVDVEAGILKALELTRRLNVKSIGVIAGPKEWHVNKLILRTMKDYAVKHNLRWSGECLDAENDGYRAMCSIHKNEVFPPDCLLVTEPAYVGACHYIIENKIKCPEKMKIIRYGMEPVNKHYDQFSTINIYSETESMGAKAVEVLLSGKRGKTPVPLKVEFSNNM
jgi:DNA-binding LacI/PurR family transcriptional regulator